MKTISLILAKKSGIRKNVALHSLKIVVIHAI